MTYILIGALSGTYSVTEKLDTVDYVDPDDGTITLRTCLEERSRVVLQMGTCDAERALKVAQKYEQDVAGIDINMGCPKEFSIKGGMGAALLKQPEKVRSILTTLVNGVRIPVTCKIRLLNSDEETLSFCRMVEQCGVAALTVHGRTRTMRPRHPVNADAIRRVAETLSIPVIANGGSREVRTRAEAERWRQRCGADSVMLARAAMWDASVFRSQGQLPMDDVITRLLQLCVRYDHPFTQAKYTVQQILRDLQQTPRGRRFLNTATLQEICELWGLGGHCQQTLGPPASPDSRPLSKRPRLEEDTVPGHAAFVRAHYTPERLPKTLLHDWCVRQGEPVPSYQLTHSDKLYRAVCTVRARKYASLWEKNKKFAEQGAALTCVKFLEIQAPAKPDRVGESGSEAAESGYTARAASVPTESAVTEKAPGPAQPEPTNTEPPTEAKTEADEFSTQTNGDTCHPKTADGSDAFTAGAGDVTGGAGEAVTGGAGEAVTGGAGDVTAGAGGAGDAAADKSERAVAGVPGDADLCCTVER